MPDLTIPIQHGPVTVSMTTTLLARCPVTTRRDRYKATIRFDALTGTVEAAELRRMCRSQWSRELIAQEDLTDELFAELADHPGVIRVRSVATTGHHSRVRTVVHVGEVSS
jgi:hypothetical protein